MLVPYICHPYTSDPKGNKEKAREIIKKIYMNSREYYKDEFFENCRFYPDDFSSLTFGLCALLAIPDSLDQDKVSREEVMMISIELLKRCDEVWVCDRILSDGMIDEVNMANKLGKKIVFKIDL